MRQLVEGRIQQRFLDVLGVKIREWGRIGRAGQVRMIPYPRNRNRNRRAEALDRQKRVKERRGYRPGLTIEPFVAPIHSMRWGGKGFHPTASRQPTGRTTVRRMSAGDPRGSSSKLTVVLPL
jgi:hypothetical protein